MPAARTIRLTLFVVLVIALLVVGGSQVRWVRVLATPPAVTPAERPNPLCGGVLMKADLTLQDATAASNPFIQLRNELGGDVPVQVMTFGPLLESLSPKELSEGDSAIEPHAEANAFGS